MAKSPIALIIGAGPGVGLSCARAFTSQGYRVIVSSRQARSSGELLKYTHIPSDLANPLSVIELFKEVKEKAGVPSVVIFNAAAVNPVDQDDPLSLSSKPLEVDVFNRNIAVNTTSVLVAAQQAVHGFKDLPKTDPRTFIYTGNILNTSPIPSLLDLGMGKSATAHLIMASATAYSKNEGFKFYYADERKADGGAAFGIDGEAHAKLFVELAQHEKQLPWLQTFVKGKGYVDFA